MYIEINENSSAKPQAHKWGRGRMRAPTGVFNKTEKTETEGDRQILLILCHLLPNCT